MHISPNDKDFKAAFEAGETQLVTHQFAGDLETPVGTYLKLCMDEPYSFLLESVEGGNVLGRYSIIGFDPDMIWTCSKGEVTIADRDGESLPNEYNDALASLKGHVKACKIDNAPDDVSAMT